MSANPPERCGGNIAVDWKKRVLEKITQCGRFSLQLTGSTDVSSTSQLKVSSGFSPNNETHTHHSLGVCATNDELQQGRYTAHSKCLVEGKQWPMGSMVEVTLMEGPFGKDV